MNRNLTSRLFILPTEKCYDLVNNIYLGTVLVAIDQFGLTSWDTKG